MSSHYYLQATPGLGQQARTFGAIAFGGSRAGAGSAYRIYQFNKRTNNLGPFLAQAEESAGRLKGINIQNGRLSLLNLIA